jgi:hypothetical protein
LFNIDEFYAELAARGTIKTSKFKLFFTLPPCFDGDPEQSYFKGLVRDMELRVCQAEIPGITHNTVNVNRYGYGSADKQPIVPNFGDVQISIIADAAGDFWRFFHKWMNKVINSDVSSGEFYGRTETNVGKDLLPYEIGYKDDYARQVGISWYSDDGTEAQQVVLNEAFPTAVSEVKLDWGDQGEVVRFMVNFACQDFYIQPVNLTGNS